MIDNFFSKKSNIILIISILIIDILLGFIYKYNLFTIILIVLNIVCVLIYIKYSINIIKYLIFLSANFIFWHFTSPQNNLNFLYLTVLAIVGAGIFYFFNSFNIESQKIIYTLSNLIILYEVGLILVNNYYNIISNSAIMFLVYYLVDGIIIAHIKKSEKIEFIKYITIFLILFSILIIKY